MKNKLNKLKIKHIQKLDDLISKSFWTVHSNENYILNLSSKVLDKNTISALGFGLNFVYSNAVSIWIRYTFGIIILFEFR